MIKYESLVHDILQSLPFSLNVFSCSAYYKIRRGLAVNVSGVPCDVQQQFPKTKCKNRDTLPPKNFLGLETPTLVAGLN